MVQMIAGKFINHLEIPKDATNGDVVNLLWKCTVRPGIIPGIIQIKFDDYPETGFTEWSSEWWNAKFQHPFSMVVPLDFEVDSNTTNKSMFEAVFGTIDILEYFSWWGLLYLRE